MTNHRPDRSVSRRAALAGLGAGALATTVRSASTHDATPVAMAGHPLVGTWTVPFAGPEDPVGPALNSYGADGIVTQIDPIRGNASGAWEAAGPRTGLVTLVFLGYAPGSKTDFTFAVARLFVEVDATGDHFAGQGEIEFRALDGTTKDGPFGFSLEGTRVRVEPLTFAVQPAAPGATPAP